MTLRTIAHQAPLSMGFSQARILQWVASPFSRESFPSRNQTCIPCITGEFVYHWVTSEAPICSIIYLMGYYSAMRKKEILPFAATWMQLKIIILSEVSQRKTNIMCYHLYLESKIWHKRTYLWNRNRHTGIENKLMVAKRKWGQEGTDWEFGVNRCKLLYVEWINNKVLL